MSHRKHDRKRNAAKAETQKRDKGENGEKRVHKCTVRTDVYEVPDCVIDALDAKFAAKMEKVGKELDKAYRTITSQKVEIDRLREYISKAEKSEDEKNKNQIKFKEECCSAIGLLMCAGGAVGLLGILIAKTILGR